MPQFQFDATCGDLADFWKTEFGMGGEPFGVEVEATLDQILQHIAEILQTEMRQQKLVMQARAPAHRPARIGAIPEGGDQSLATTQTSLLMPPRCNVAAKGSLLLGTRASPPGITT